mmetsp:Transcript_120582/g.352194  ORF Transcript_120582/g.352194 Transcript_120582/m.352194 type:complete len:210 (+) Transcript_120582:1193-1822(+)
MISVPSATDSAHIRSVICLTFASSKVTMVAKFRLSVIAAIMSFSSSGDFGDGAFFSTCAAAPPPTAPRLGNSILVLRPSSSNFSRLTHSASTFVSAVIVAVRGSSRSRAFSPKKSPDLSVATTLPSTSTLHSPPLITKNSLPSSPCLMMTFPGSNFFCTIALARAGCSAWGRRLRRRTLAKNCKRSSSAPPSPASFPEAQPMAVSGRSG